MSAAQTTISIHVSPEAAQAFFAASTEERRKIELLLSLRLLEVTRPQKPLSQVMREISRTAQARGLTSEMLDDLLEE